MQKFEKKKVEAELFQEDEFHLKKLLDKEKKGLMEINLGELGDDDFEFNLNAESDKNLDKILKEVKLSEENKIDSFQENMTTENIDIKIDVDTFDGLDITKYIKNNI